MSTAAPLKPHAPGNPYQLARPLGRCSVCATTIQPGQKYLAAIRDLPLILERLDLCTQCSLAFDRKPLLAFWPTVMPHPHQKKQIFVDNEVLCTLFERLAQTTDQPKLNFRFVLGLILIRKRLLIYESSRKENSHDIWIVRFRGRQDNLDLLDPKLTEQQVAEVSTQLGEILNEEL